MIQSSPHPLIHKVGEFGGKMKGTWQSHHLIMKELYILTCFHS